MGNAEYMGLDVLCQPCARSRGKTQSLKSRPCPCHFDRSETTQDSTDNQSKRFVDSRTPPSAHDLRLSVSCVISIRSDWRSRPSRLLPWLRCCRICVPLHPTSTHHDPCCHQSCQAGHRSFGQC